MQSRHQTTLNLLKKLIDVLDRYNRSTRKEGISEEEKIVLSESTQIKATALHQEIVKSLSILNSSDQNFKLLMQAVASYLASSLDSSLSNKYCSNVTNLLKKLSKKFPDDLQPYANYFVYLACLTSRYCLGIYTNITNESSADNELLFILRDTSIALGNFVNSRKGKNDRITFAAKLHHASITHIPIFTTEKFKEKFKHNQNIVKGLTNVESSLKLKNQYTSKLPLSACARENSDAKCLNFWLEMYNMCVLVDIETQKNTNHNASSLMHAINSYHLDEIISFMHGLDEKMTGNMEENLPVNDGLGINIYRRLIDMFALFQTAILEYTKASPSGETKIILEKFRNTFSECPIVIKAIGKEDCETRINNINKIILFSKDNLETIETDFKRFTSDVITYIETDSGLENISTSYCDLHSSIEKIPHRYIQRHIYKSMLYYLGTKVMDGTEILKAYFSSTSTFMKFIRSDERFSIDAVENINYTINILSSLSWICIKSYENNTKRTEFLDILKNAKDTTLILVKIMDGRNDIYQISAIMLAASICYIPHLINYKDDNKKSIIDEFLDNKTFNDIHDNAQKKYAKNGSNHEKCLLHWLHIFTAESLMLNTDSIKELQKIDFNLLIDFIKSLDFDVIIPDSRELNYNYPGISLGVNIYINLFYKLEKMIESAEFLIFALRSNLGEHTLSACPDYSSWKELYDLYQYEYKLLDFKSRLYDLDIIRKTGSAEKSDDAINDAKSRMKIIQSYLDTMNNKKSEFEKKKLGIKSPKLTHKSIKKLLRSHHKSQKENERILPKDSVKENGKNFVDECIIATSPTDNLENIDPVIHLEPSLSSINDDEANEINSTDTNTNHGNIIIPGYLESIFTRASEAGHTAWLVGGATRDSNKPNDYDLVIDASMEKIVSLFKSEGILIFCNYPIFSIQCYEKEIQIRPLSSWKNAYHFEPVSDTRRGTVYIPLVHSPEDDARERLLTVNAIFWNPETGYIDPYQGRDDIKNRQIRFIKDPVESIHKYRPVIFQILRLMARSDYQLDEELASILVNYLYLLKDENKGRMMHEINKTLSEKNHIHVLDLFKKFSLLQHAYGLSPKDEAALLETLAYSLGNQAIKSSAILLWYTIVSHFIHAKKESSPEAFNRIFRTFGIREEVSKQITRLFFLFHSRIDHIECENNSFQFTKDDHGLVDILINHYAPSKFMDSFEPKFYSKMQALFFAKPKQLPLSERNMNIMHSHRNSHF